MCKMDVDSMLGMGIFSSDGAVGWDVGREKRKSSLESPARMISARRCIADKSMEQNVAADMIRQYRPRLGECCGFYP